MLNAWERLGRVTRSTPSYVPRSLRVSRRASVPQPAGAAVIKRPALRPTAPARAARPIAKLRSTGCTTIPPVQPRPCAAGRTKRRTVRPRAENHPRSSRAADTLEDGLGSGRAHTTSSQGNGRIALFCCICGLQLSFEAASWRQRNAPVYRSCGFCWPTHVPLVHLQRSSWAAASAPPHAPSRHLLAAWPVVCSIAGREHFLGRQAGEAFDTWGPLHRTCSPPCDGAAHQTSTPHARHTVCAVLSIGPRAWRRVAAGGGLQHADAYRPFRCMGRGLHTHTHIARSALGGRSLVWHLLALGCPTRVCDAMGTLWLSWSIVTRGKRLSVRRAVWTASLLQRERETV